MIETFLTTGTVLLRIFSNPFGNVFQKQLTKDNHPLLINFLTYLLLSFVCLFINECNGCQKDWFICDTL